jgi:hypothetical protein
VVFLDLPLLRARLELVQQVLEAVGHAFAYDLVIDALKDVADSSLILAACAECGTTDSVLVHQAHKSQQAARSRVLERAAVMSS